ncbi:hypothetical protein E4U42_003442 [Claviceps africana]|uniref:Up-regulated during septation protein 1 domain-containing protein n=1 Tax=Claviceps africana TaxID=83212 RepID=A0A8K0J768_9HYPO|nr:hypothetical protein E4U42_003442 [Claviceps africana]
MAHIANCVANADHGSISKSFSPAPSVLSITSPNLPLDKPFTWRMLPADAISFKNKPLPSLKINRTPHSTAAVDATVTEQQTAGGGLRHRPSPQAPARRGKMSGSDSGLTATVQGPIMDSPTIPGLHALHEWSASVPSNTEDKRRGESHRLVERTPAPAPGVQQRFAQVQSQSQPESNHHRLPPLYIPTAESFATLLKSKKSSAKLGSDSTSPLSLRSAGRDTSPWSRTRILASSSTPDLLYPRSAATTTDPTCPSNSSALLSAPGMECLCVSPNNWDSTGFRSAQIDRRQMPATPDGRGNGTCHVHLRGRSESSNIGTDRGRSRYQINHRNNSGPLLQGNNESNQGHKKREISLERRAFEELPKGWKPAEASCKHSASDLFALQKQALEQAERFEVLRIDDVDALSKELRQLDERTEYLRRTQTSLRAGRRDLHSRICQYLRSPRAAQFSPYSILKQEESLAELDASIDQWAAKLEQAENRRTRVRQKLLEHVAAAAIVGRPNGMASMSESLQQMMGVQSPTGPREPSTPPRSPVQSSLSGQGGNALPSPAKAVAQIPSTILEQPVLEDVAEDRADASRASRTTSIFTLSRGHVESIRIYAGDDVFALLADVENEMVKMGTGDSPVVAPELVAAHGSRWEAGTERERQQERQRTHEKLHGHSGSSLFVSPWSSRPETQLPASPETSPTSINVSRPTEPLGASAAPGSALGLILSTHRHNVERLAPSSLMPAVNKSVTDAGPLFLTSAVFKP